MKVLMLPFSLMSEVYVVLGWPTPLPQLQERALDPAWAVNVEGLVQRWATGHMAQPRLSKPARLGCVKTFGERACFLLNVAKLMKCKPPWNGRALPTEERTQRKPESDLQRDGILRTLSSGSS